MTLSCDVDGGLEGKYVIVENYVNFFFFHIQTCNNTFGHLRAVETSVEL